jgi:hypothetical protein
MRPKRRPSAPELRAELAGLPRYMAGVAAQVGAAGVAAGYRAQAAAIERGDEIRLRAWGLPDWLAGTYHPDTWLILGADNVLRINPAPPC